MTPWRSQLFFPISGPCSKDSIPIHADLDFSPKDVIEMGTNRLYRNTAFYFDPIVYPMYSPDSFTRLIKDLLEASRQSGVALVRNGTTTSKATGNSSVRLRCSYFRAPRAPSKDAPGKKLSRRKDSDGGWLEFTPCNFGLMLKRTHTGFYILNTGQSSPFHCCVRCSPSHTGTKQPTSSSSENVKKRKKALSRSDLSTDAIAKTKQRSQHLAVAASTVDSEAPTARRKKKDGPAKKLSRRFSNRSLAEVDALLRDEEEEGAGMGLSETTMMFSHEFAPVDTDDAMLANTSRNKMAARGLGGGGASHFFELNALFKEISALVERDPGQMNSIKAQLRAIVEKGQRTLRQKEDLRNGEQGLGFVFC